MIKMCNGKAVRLIGAPIIKIRIAATKRDSAEVGVLVIGETYAREEVAFQLVEFITARRRELVRADMLTDVREPENYS